MPALARKARLPCAVPCSHACAPHPHPHPPPQESRATAAAAAAALARGASFSAASDIEAPLLAGAHAPAGQEAAANGTSPVPGGSPVVKFKPEGQHRKREGKALWALVRNALGAPRREGLGGLGAGGGWRGAGPEGAPPQAPPRQACLRAAFALRNWPVRRSPALGAAPVRVQA